MSNLSWKKLGLAALIAGGAQIAALSGASATTLPVTQGTAPRVSQQDGNVIQVGKSTSIAIIVTGMSIGAIAVAIAIGPAARDMSISTTDTTTPPRGGP